ncbi:MAG: trimethylamine methyltransferase family protein [Anaerolineae bacterium]|nr:trimethylamine methyltransferase family protein [Anaerolineae bacterium]
MMDGPSWVQPRIEVLSRAQIAQIHARAAHILASTGVRVDAPYARKRLIEAGADGDAENAIVRLPRQLVDWALKVAPSHVEVYDRRGAHAFRLGRGDARFGIGVTTLYYQDPVEDKLEPFARAHMRSLVRLAHALPGYDVISTVGVPQDVGPEVSDLYAALDSVANTTKPLVLLVSDESRFAAVLDLLEELTGDLAPRPFVLPYVNPITPLVLNEGTVLKMELAIERGLPLIFSSYGMAGATTPITPDGAMILLNAELLAGLTLAQVLREGTPVILGALPACFDMRGMGSYYDPTSYVLNLACAEIMDWYGVPHCGTSGSGIGWGPDLLTAAHQWVNHLTSCLGKVGLAPFVGDVLGSKAFSPAAMVLANEAIAQARWFARGFALDRALGSEQEIALAGPGGSFLVSGSTLAHLRDATYRSEVFGNLTLEAWQAQGQPSADQRLRAHTRQLLREAAPPDDYAALMARGEAFIAGLRGAKR